MFICATYIFKYTGLFISCNTVLNYSSGSNANVGVRWRLECVELNIYVFYRGSLVIYDEIFTYHTSGLV